MMEKHVCRVCHYVYNPDEGDPNNGIVSGTSFQALPEDWTCPVCGSEKKAFQGPEE